MPSTVSTSVCTTVIALPVDPLKQQELRWLSEVSCVPIQQPLRHLDKSFTNFFEGRAKYPTFKKRRNRQIADTLLPHSSGMERSLQLAKMTEPLAIVWSRSLPDGAKPSTVTVTKDGANRYFVSLLIEEDIKQLEQARAIYWC